MEPKAFSTRVIRRLIARFDGEIITPVSCQYPVARRVWNRAVTKHPAVIARCTSRDDVLRSMEFARQNDLPIALRSGGHSFAGFGVCDDGIVIDLSRMKQSRINPESATVTIEPGIRGGELDCMTQAFKMAVPLGSCPAVGVTGYALGGGESSLTPRFGYGCDSILNVEIITADGHLLSANREENKDLFWALCGAGANFGVAVSLTFQMHPVDQVLSGHLKYPIRQASKVLNFIKHYAPTLPDDMFLVIAVLPHPGERMLDISVVSPGRPSAGMKALRPLRTFLRPLADTIEIRSYLDEQRTASDSPDDTIYSSQRRSGHLANLTSESIVAILEHVSNSPSEASGITMIYWHGPWSSKSRNNAFGFRRTGYEYWIHSYWQHANHRRGAQDWVQRFYSALAPLSTGAVYVNGLEDEGEERLRAAYGSKYKRLQNVKYKFDHDNIFRVNQNIIPLAPR